MEQRTQNDGCLSGLKWCMPMAFKLTTSHVPCHTQYPEFGIQASMTLLMLLTGRWLVGGLHLLALGYNVRLVFLQQHTVDVTEVFRWVRGDPTPFAALLFPI